MTITSLWGRRGLLLVLPAVIVLGSAIVWVQQTGANDASIAAGDSSTPRVVTDTTLARYASSSARDWVTYADAVARIRITGERAQPSVESETATGAGVDVLGRDVKADVDTVLWSRPESGRVELPSKLTIPAYGWMVDEEGARIEMVGRGASRLDVDHTYIVALKWYPPSCVGEDGASGTWGPIGTGGVIPVGPGGTLGAGEFEGATLTPTQFRKQVPGGSLRADVAGSTVVDVKAALASAAPDAAAAQKDPC